MLTRPPQPNTGHQLRRNPTLSTDRSDGLYYVRPRHLACSTGIGDSGLQPLLAAGWDRSGDDLGNLYLDAPDRTVSLGYLPEGEDDALWEIAARVQPFAPPRWTAAFSDTAPTELVTAFTTELAAHNIQSSGLRLPASTFHETVAPLIQAGWTLTDDGHRAEVTAPDGMAGLVRIRGPLNHHREMTTNDTRWYLWGGPHRDRPTWYAVHSTHTPLHLVTATLTAVADPAPVVRWRNELSAMTRRHAHLAPVAPRPAPVPTPRDVRRRTPPAPPALASSLRWTSTTPTRRSRSR